MTRTLIRRMAMLLIAMLGFAQASIAFADCPMERASIAHMVSMSPDESCEDCASSLTGPVYANRCAAHCATDAQLTSSPVTLVRGVAEAPVFVLPPIVLPAPKRGLEAPPPGTPPRRILLHSFLV